MKRPIVLLAIIIVLMSAAAGRAGANHWVLVGNKLAIAERQTSIKAEHYIVYSADEQALKADFEVLEQISGPSIITLPLPDGTFMDFKVTKNATLPPTLAAAYPNIKTYNAIAVSNQGITAKIDFTEFGFHAMIYDGDKTSFVDPVSSVHDGSYMVHYKKDETREPEELAKCSVSGTTPPQVGGSTLVRPAETKTTTAQRTTNGTVLRTYRLALACDFEYARAATGLPHPTKAQALSKMVTTLNRVNGIYERELAVTMILVPNDTTIIFVDSATDMFLGLNGYPSGLVNQNQVVCDSFIRDSNYDVGHVFTTGGGGLSGVGVTCISGVKATSETGGSNPVGDGFDVDYVAHEIGHEYGGQHPFNDAANGSCANPGAIVPESAYEPGSGSTIMAYAGICPPDDLQPHSDPYFHAQSLLEMTSYITTTGDGCAVKTPTANKPVYIAPIANSYIIPYLTPFELTAPTVVDSVADTLTTYCWEQWNLGDLGKTFADTCQFGPIFRSDPPVNSPTRIFPKLSLLLHDSLSNAGIENNQGEKVSNVGRYLTFKLTVRDVYNGYGCVVTPDDTVHIDVINTGSGFSVTSPATYRNWPGGTTQTVTWNVGGSTASPISCDSVNVMLSGDGGYTWPYFEGRFANTGSATIAIPDIPTDSFVRVKVKCANNIFFSISPTDILVTHVDSTVLLFPVELKMGPSPVTNTLHASFLFNEPIKIVITDAIGREIFKGTMEGNADIPVTGWPRGIYFARFYNTTSSQVDVRKFLIE